MKSVHVLLLSLFVAVVALVGLTRPAVSRQDTLSDHHAEQTLVISSANVQTNPVLFNYPSAAANKPIHVVAGSSLITWTNGNGCGGSGYAAAHNVYVYSPGSNPSSGQGELSGQIFWQIGSETHCIDEYKYISIYCGSTSANDAGTGRCYVVNGDGGDDLIVGTVTIHLSFWW